MTVIVETKEQEEPELTELGKQAAIAFGYKPEIHYESTFTDAAGNILAVLQHKELRARIHWVDGFFTAIKLKKQYNGNKGSK